jgi:DNA-binding NarL/FixJ family response regulator
MKDSLWISKKFVKQLVVRLSALSRLWNLKSIELDIIGLLGKGMDNDMIAKTLGTNTRNIKLRTNNIQKKSDVRDRFDLINLSKQFSVFQSSEIDHIH